MSEATVLVSPEIQRASAEDILGPDPGKRRSVGRGEKITAQRKKSTLKMLIASNAIRPVTILNFNPFPLKVNGGHLFQEEIPGCETGQDYTLRVISDVRWSNKDHGVGLDNVDNIEAEAHLPAEIALEYKREYTELQQFGGVFVYFGTKNPSEFGPREQVQVPIAGTEEDGSKTVDSETVVFREEFVRYQSQSNRSIMRRLQNANQLWESDATRNQVNNVDREMARRALHKNLIKALPVWVVDAGLITGTVTEPCLCGATPAVGAAVCKNCSHILDPVKAYEGAAIEYGHVSFDKLDKAGWEAVNAIKAKREKARAAAGGPATK